jgi:DNA replication protein DnaC
MKTTNPVDAARIELMLSDLRLPAIKSMWAKLAEQSDKEGWPAARFLAALAEHEIADRGRRRIERHLAEASPTFSTGDEKREFSMARAGICESVQGASV